MSNSISAKIGELDSEYILEENKKGIVVKVPCMDHDREGNEIVNFNIVEISDSEKILMIRQFFDEEVSSIIRGGVAYNIDDVLFDEISLPAQKEPEEIVD